MIEILGYVLDEADIQIDNKYVKKVLNVIRHHGNAIIT